MTTHTSRLLALGLLPLLGALGLAGCYRPNVGECPPGADCAIACAENSDCPSGELCSGAGSAAGGVCLPPTVDCAGLGESECGGTLGCQPIYVIPPCVPGSQCPSTFDHCVTIAAVGCGSLADEPDCDARPDCEWVWGAASDGGVADCVCDCPANPAGGACACACPAPPTSPVAAGYCQVRQDECPPEWRTPGGCITPPRCPDGQVAYQGQCLPACDLDVGCNLGSTCTLEADPTCLNSCPANANCICQGACVPAPVDCTTLDEKSCLSVPQCELQALYPPCACDRDPSGNCQPCGPIYQCTHATGRSCEQLNETECSSREDCSAQRCGECPPGADCICAPDSFQGCATLKPRGCAGLDEASCLASSSCQAEYAGVDCGCPANDPSCACATAGTTCACPANQPDCECSVPPPSDGYLGCVDRPVYSSCEQLDEASCGARGDCQAVYAGEGCSCNANDDCSCSQLKYDYCATVGYPPTGPQPEPATDGAARR